MKRKGKIICYFFMPSLLALVLIISFMAFQRNLKQHVHQNAYRSLNEIAMEHKYYFHCRLEGELNVLKTLAASLSEEKTRDDSSTFAKMDKLAEITGFQCFSIIDIDGTRVSNHGYRDNISAFSFFPKMKKGEPVISEPTTSLVDGKEKEVIFMTYPVRQNGFLQYTLMGAYEIKELGAVLFSASLGGESYSTIINTNGDVILIDEHQSRLSYQSNIFEFYKVVSFQEPYSLEKLKEEIKNEKQGAFSYEYGENFRMGYFQPSGINGWTILSVMPEVLVSNSTDSIAVIVNRLIFWVTLVFVILLLWIFAKTKAESLRLKEKAEKDGMTGILNKITEENQIKSFLEERNGNRHALFVLDIDNFKGINDNRGHVAGDEVIISVATLLKKVFRQEDIIGRIGGDEFAVLFKDIKEESDLLRKAGEVISAFQTLELHLNIPVSCSIGIAVTQEEQIGFANLYEVADRALYEAKNAGKGQYRIIEVEKE